MLHNSSDCDYKTHINKVCPPIETTYLCALFYRRLSIPFFPYDSHNPTTFSIFFGLHLIIKSCPCHPRNLLQACGSSGVNVTISQRLLLIKMKMIPAPKRSRTKRSVIQKQSLVCSRDNIIFQSI